MTSSVILHDNIQRNRKLRWQVFIMYPEGRHPLTPPLILSLAYNSQIFFFFYPHMEALYRKENFLIKLVRKQQQWQFITDMYKSHLYAKIYI